jgi:hypothetical protein
VGSPHHIADQGWCTVGSTSGRNTTPAGALTHALVGTTQRRSMANSAAAVGPQVVPG